MRYIGSLRSDKHFYFMCFLDCADLHLREKYFSGPLSTEWAVHVETYPKVIDKVHPGLNDHHIVRAGHN